MIGYPLTLNICYCFLVGKLLNTKNNNILFNLYIKYGTIANNKDIYTKSLNGGLKEKNNSTTIAEKELQRQKIFKWGIKRKK